MARRQKWNQVASGGVDGERSSLGDNHVTTAIHTIDKWAAASAAMQVKFDYRRDQFLPWIFSDDALAKLSAARDLYRPHNTQDYYEIAIGEPDPGLTGVQMVQLYINFEDAPVHAPTASALYVQTGRAEPLLEALERLKQVYEQFETVKHVLRWLNRNATPGAIRHYFPAAMRLCPESPGLTELIHTPLRYTTPDGIAEQLNLIRTAANTVASAALMPADASPNGYDKAKACWVVFPSYYFTPQGTSTRIKTDQQSFFL